MRNNKTLTIENKIDIPIRIVILFACKKGRCKEFTLFENVTLNNRMISCIYFQISNNICCVKINKKDTLITLYRDSLEKRFQRYGEDSIYSLYLHSNIQHKFSWPNYCYRILKTRKNNIKDYDSFPCVNIRDKNRKELINFIKERMKNGT